MSLHVLGVRHHSPACARLVETRLRELRPATVLIEGPSDMNERLAELDLPHHLPIAIFSYCHSPARSFSSWAPFCDYSPEWRALRVGREIGADVRFMDLPSWAPAFRGERNRYADHDRFHSEYVNRLCRRLAMDGPDALWDHLFELPCSDREQRLEEYFRALRPIQEDPDESQREAFMGACIAWAMKQGGEVVAVCGGYHKPYLEQIWTRFDPEWPELPQPEPEARTGSYLIPYSFKRLDSFVGYEAGMPSPAYYQAVWELGVENAGEELLRLVTRRLRQRKQPVSASDLVAAFTMARGLMQLRQHTVMARTDLLDGLASALLKESQEKPLPWTERGPLPVGTDPLVVEMVSALSGERQGALAAGTPRPPLVMQVGLELARLGLTPPATLSLELEDPAQRERSHFLHGLQLLSIPGFVRTSGPDWATEVELKECWKLTDLPTTETALIEASSWGGTLESAALNCLQDRAREASGDTGELAEILSRAFFAGLSQLASKLLEQLQLQVGHESRFARLGLALSRLLELWRYDQVLGGAGHGVLGELLLSLFERGLWLVENLQGKGCGEDRAHIVGMLALRDTLVHAGKALELPFEPAHQVMLRKSCDLAAPPAVRGAALGFLGSTSPSAPLEDWVERASEAIRRASQPDCLGDFLSGLFALAREQVVGCSQLVAVLDAEVESLDASSFFQALPSLRLAFSYFPPRQRDQLARALLLRHSQDPDQARGLTGRLSVSPALMAQGFALQERTHQYMQRFGLL